MKKGTKRAPSGGMYAVAIRDDQLYLYIRIRRTPKGEIFLVYPTGRSKELNREWNPHTSHHASGRVHQKAFGHEYMAHDGQKPDSKFTGVKNLVTRPIAASEPKAFGIICNPTEFADVFEIPVADISPAKNRTNIAVDVTEPGGTPVTTPGSRIIRNWIIQDTIPWIMVTVFEAPS